MYELRLWVGSLTRNQIKRITRYDTWHKRRHMQAMSHKQGVKGLKIDNPGDKFLYISSNSLRYLLFRIICWTFGSLVKMFILQTKIPFAACKGETKWKWIFDHCQKQNCVLRTVWVWRVGKVEKVGSLVYSSCFVLDLWSLRCLKCCFFAILTWYQ